MRRPLVLLALLALPAVPLAAQVTLDFTPRLGVYVPLKDLVVGVDPTTGLDLVQRAQTKFTIGGRLGVWLAPAFGFEGVADYNKSGVKSTLAGIPSETVGSSLFSANGRAMVRLGSRDGVSMILSAGGGMVSRGGDFITGSSPPFTNLSGNTDVTGVAGISFLVPLGRTVAARIDVDGMTYKAQYTSAIFGSTGTQRQYDLLIMFGLTGPFKHYGVPGED